jgi:DNA-binding response OmpR family regulator
MTKILLVDDEPSIVKMVGKRLQIEGFEVVVAMDGEEALAKVASEKPDLVILDFMLPKKNGYEVCSALKADPQMQSIPVLLFTAKAMEPGLGPGAGCGANGYVRKPFQSAELLTTIKSLLGGTTA